MATSFSLDATTRQEKGKGAGRRLRRQGNRIPGIIYGGEHPPMMLSFDHYQLSHALSHEAFYSHILTIRVDGAPERAVLKDVQRHPFKPYVTHIDLLRITGKDKITMNIPLHFIGADKAPGVVNDGGIVSHLMNDIEVRCLPDHLPEYIEVDISQLTLEHPLHLSDLKLPEGVELVELSQGHDNDLPVVNIHLPRAAIEEEETPAVAASEVPTIEKGKAVAEGAAAEATEGKKEGKTEASKSAVEGGKDKGGKEKEKK